jgi:hypothetical protein
MTPDESSRYGKPMCNAAIHLGLRDLLDWMQDMEAKGVVPF